MSKSAPRAWFFRGRVGLIGLFAAALSPLFADEGSKVEYKPLSVGALSEFGMFREGRAVATPIYAEWEDHFAAFMTQSAILDDRWFMNVGIGGVFEFPKPERAIPYYPGSQYKNFFVGPTVADIEYLALNSASKTWRVGLGMYSYKYNPDASNLGEYLFRTGPYPTYIMTGSYVFVNNSAASLQGMRSFFTLGKNFSADVFINTETTMPPLYDLSLAAMFKYRIADGLLDLGAGVNFKRLVPIKPSRTTVKNPQNAYFSSIAYLDSNGVQVRDSVLAGSYSGNTAYYQKQAEFYKAKLASATNRQDSARDSALFQSAQSTYQSVNTWVTDASIQPDYHYYTQKGIILDAMAALDLKKWIRSDVFGDNDLRIYAEAAVLGVQDYPVFYKHWWQRSPVMVGVNLPGFRFIDLISLQVEYFNSPNLNSFLSNIQTNQAVPDLDNFVSTNEFGDGLDRDNVCWSLLVKKQLTRGVFFSAQAARDHTRFAGNASFLAGPALDPNEVFYANDSKNWYWMVQFSFGI